MPDNGFGHLVLNVGPLAHDCVVLHLFAPHRDVRQLAAETTAVLAAFGVEAAEDFVNLFRNLHDCSEGAEGALLQTVETSLKTQIKLINFKICLTLDKLGIKSFLSIS